jgi:hypothetical protein
VFQRTPKHRHCSQPWSPYVFPLNNSIQSGCNNSAQFETWIAFVLGVSGRVYLGFVGVILRTFPAPILVPLFDAIFATPLILSASRF